MRLSKIKLAGFKSFVDPTVVDFPSNLVAVVGPNGCGKSNIIDAVRWVMGESSAKYLRGESMTDVIFNGSSHRKPVGKASIELVFDNSDGSLSGEYSHYTEVAIKREVTREGQSNYFLNSTRCRRRDITDIFLGTGLGPRSYAIIEQGMISRFIEAKPEELRTYFEEAAGISKYKERRRETETRMRHTQENLDRLNDLREELNKQLAHLQQQAQIAETYREYKQQERTYTLQLQLVRWLKWDNKAQQNQAHMQTLGVDIEREQAQVVEAEARLLESQEHEHSTQAQFQQVQQGFYRLGEQIARIEQSLQHARERQKQLDTSWQQLASSEAELANHVQQDQQQITQLTEQLAELEPKVSEAEARGEQLEELLLEAEAALDAGRHDWERCLEQVNRSSQQAQAYKLKIEQLEQQLRQQQQRQDQLKQQQQPMDPAVIEAIQQGQAQVEELELANAAAEQRQQQQQGLIAQLRRDNQQHEQQLSQQRSQLQSCQGQVASLTALQQDALSSHSNQLSDWLQQHGLDQQPRLATQLEVTPKWATALEHVLGSMIQGYCLTDWASLLNDWPQDVQDPLTLIQPAALAPERTDTPSLAAEVTSAQSWLPGLSHIYLADTLDQAEQRRGQLAAHESIICPDGTWLGSNWLRSPAQQGQDNSVFIRQQKLDALQQEQEQLTEVVAQLSDQLDQGREQLQQAEQTYEHGQQQRLQAERQLNEQRQRVASQQAELQRQQDRQARLHEDLSSLQQSMAHDQEAVGELRLDLESALEQMAMDDQQRDALKAQQQHQQQRVSDLRQQSSQQREQLRQQQLKLHQQQSQLTSAQAQLARWQAQTASLETRKAALNQELAHADEPIEQFQQQLEELLAQRLEAEDQVQEAQRALDEIKHQGQQWQAQAKAAQQQLVTQRDAYQSKELAYHDACTRRDTERQQMVIEEAEFEQVIANIDPAIKEQETARNLSQIQDKIKRLGAINLAAIEEYQTQQERKVYLDAQYDDLIKALETLENAIRKIDRETRASFKTTFDQVNAGLQQNFPKVFGGGQAQLALTDDDLLSAGVTIMARPPGKRNSTIHLLSGGEKALTAVALVFAIFQLNPAPFCMLDEVDAPLDDANVGRFCNLVKDMSTTVQFVFISHNKVAMEMAQHLIGVTMHEPGVSRPVTVNIDDALAFAEQG